MNCFRVSENCVCVCVCDEAGRTEERINELEGVTI